jgi:hypothetical protein
MDVSTFPIPVAKSASPDTLPRVAGGVLASGLTGVNGSEQFARRQLRTGGALCFLSGTKRSMNPYSRHRNPFALMRATFH